MATALLDVEEGKRLGLNDAEAVSVVSALANLTHKNPRSAIEVSTLANLPMCSFSHFSSTSCSNMGINMSDHAGLAKSNRQCLDSDPTICSACASVQQDIFRVAGTRQGTLVYNIQLACDVLQQYLDQAV